MSSALDRWSGTAHLKATLQRAKLRRSSLVLLVCGAVFGSLIGCANRTDLARVSSPAVIASAEPQNTASQPPRQPEEVFAITQEYFQNTYQKTEGFLRCARNLYDTGLVREAMPYLDTALLTILDSQIELVEFPKMAELYQQIYDLNAKILKSNPHALDIYLDNRWSHFNTKNYTVPIVLNNSVRHFIEEYQTASRAFIERTLRRSGRYMPMIKQELHKAGLPEDLAYLVIVESGFSPYATSYARARGLWQFMPSTGRRYGLKMNYWVDERCDPEKSTRAAIGYLKDLYDEFASWKLVLASYNGGEGAVRQAIEQCGTSDFWDVMSSARIHPQTREYVPRFMAATIIAKYPEKFGFYVDYEDPVEYDEITIQGWLGLKKAAECAGTTYKTLRALNPELRRWCTPPIYSRYNLKIPKGRKDKFLAAYRKLPTQAHSRILTHRIRSGETLSSIARRYGSSVRAIKQANGMRTSRIRAGRKLLVPVLSKRSSKPSKPSAARLKWSETITHRVKSGNTLFAIAQKYGSSVRAIKQANGLKSNKIRPGQKLIVPILKKNKSKKK
ncbi:MAG TPA: LysM peptidoglycan-binding domain-containing protein [bacterium]|nr:LysM peptidoglycan-binding domain-containing protein [bacterium]